MVWLAQNVSGVVFPAPSSSPPNVLSLWLTAVGSEPDNFQKGVPASVASGNIGDLNVTINAQPGRIQVVVSAVGDDDPNKVPTLSDLSQGLRLAKTLSQKLCNDSNPVRVSLTANCLEEAEDSLSANRRFVHHTRVTSIPEDAIDLNFALNRREKVGGAGWDINCICRWATSQLQYLTFTLNAGEPTQPQVKVARDVVTLLIDVNTVPRGALPLGAKQSRDALDRIETKVLELISGGYDALISG